MNQYGGGAIIFALEWSEQSGAVDILATLKCFRATWAGQRRARLGQVDRCGSENCPQDSQAETFAVRRYTLTGSEGYMDAGHPTRH